MRGSNSLGIAATAAVGGGLLLFGSTSAFGFGLRSITHHRPTTTTIQSNKALCQRTRLYSAPLSKEQDQSQEQDQPEQNQEHHHSKVWNAILSTSPNSYVNPSVELAIRPPSEGGTGIVAVEDMPADAVAMCLPLEEVGMIDAASILDSYEETEGDDNNGGDEVLTMLKEMWSKELASTKSRETSEEGKRLAVLAGIIAHLQLTRYKDVMAWTSDAVKEGSYALEQSRRLGPFLDAMPLLPQHKDNVSENNPRHPFPTHFLYWTDDEIQILLQGTMGQTKAREVRAGIGLVVREWSASFLKEHSGAVTQTQILNAIFSAFTAVLSRSFGDAAGRDLDGKGRMLVPLVDMLNHDGEDPNVSWKWHVGEGDEDKIAEGKGDIVVSTLREVKKGEELYKCYGWRPAWDIASSYGFVPALKKERWECTVIPLFPAVLDLAPDVIPTPNQMAKDETILDMLLESNYGALVKGVIAAVNAANEVKARQKSEGDEDDGADEEDDRPDMLNRLEVVSLFRPPPKMTAEEFPFPRRQPCVVVGTKIQTNSAGTDNSKHHRHTIESILPAFRAAASALSQLRKNHQNSSNDNVEASQMAMAAASLDKSTDWDALALDLIKEGMKDRVQTLVNDGRAAEAWRAKQNDANGTKDGANREHRQFRVGVAGDVRDAELNVLVTLQKTVVEW